MSVYIYIYVYIWIFLYSYIRICINSDMWYLYTYKCIHIYIYIYVYIYIYICLSICKYIYIYIYVYIYICVYISLHTSTYLHMYTYIQLHLEQDDAKNCSKLFMPHVSTTASLMRAFRALRRCVYGCGGSAIHRQMEQWLLLFLPAAGREAQAAEQLSQSHSWISNSREPDFIIAGANDYKCQVPVLWWWFLCSGAIWGAGQGWAARVQVPHWRVCLLGGGVPLAPETHLSSRVEKLCVPIGLFWVYFESTVLHIFGVYVRLVWPKRTIYVRHASPWSCM